MTDLYDTFWKFANERLSLMKNRVTEDPILQRHKFTNCYRACDRVSQYLIKNVIQDERCKYSKEDVLLRVLLFKVFNRIDTWEWLETQFQRWKYSECIDWRMWHVADVMGWMDEWNKTHPLFTGVYRITSKPCFGEKTKYGNYLMCIDHIMKNYEQVIEIDSAESMFYHLLQVPLLGPFMAMQLTTDLGYAGWPWTENDYIYPGPGCKRGVSKCFGIAFGDLDSIMSKLVEVQGDGYERFPGLELPPMKEGQDRTIRPLSLMDVQNLFCEFDKYMRVANPAIEVAGFGSRKVAKRPKQQYSPACDDDGNRREPMVWPDSYRFPEHWYA